MDYHQEHDLSSCLFYGNELTEKRMLALGQAIALCYFLSTLEAEGRQPKNLIVVVDDPISMRIPGGDGNLPTEPRRQF